MHVELKGLKRLCRKNCDCFVFFKKAKESYKHESEKEESDMQISKHIQKIVRSEAVCGMSEKMAQYTLGDSTGHLNQVFYFSSSFSICTTEKHNFC